MRHFARPVVKRARQHLLYVLHVQQVVSYSQDRDLQSESREALVRGNGVDAAWFWPESLIRQAAVQLEHAGIATIAFLSEDSPGSELTLTITITAKGEKFLRSGKAFRCRTTRQSLCANSNSRPASIRNSLTSRLDSGPGPESSSS